MADVKLEKDETPVTVTFIGVASNTFLLHLAMNVQCSSSITGDNQFK